VSCEFYYSEEEIAEAGGNCPIHGRPVELLAEENYFFRLSAYQDRLLEHYEENPSAVEPEVRRNEVLSVIRAGLRDFSVSRTSFDWGVPLPWDPKHVCYVWFDALTNYITAAGYGSDDEAFATWWPGTHMIGKDILRQHAIYWPAMLMAAGIDPPRQVWAHGYLLVGGEKMSKTKLTGIHPFELVDHFGVDAYRYYFLREIQFGGDGSFSWESMVERYNADLANDLGNLASRVMAMTASYFDGVVPAPPEGEGSEARLGRLAFDVAKRMDAQVEAMDLTGSLVTAWELIKDVNKWLVEVAPWAVAKDPERRDDLSRAIYAGLESLRVIAILLQPAMPNMSARLWTSLGIREPLADQRLEDAAWGRLAPGTQTVRGENLFPRLDS
jgi:methionyl-tRNA synthetase